MALLSAFEIVAENLVPQGILPPDASNPFLIQGYWVEISLALGITSGSFNIVFQETTDFTQGKGQSSLNAQYIDAKGEANVYPDFFASAERGFLNQSIYAGQTLIYGVQCLPFGPSQQGQDLEIPQSGTGWRGTVQVDGVRPNMLIATPTQRLVYYRRYDKQFRYFVDATVYPVPTFSGGTMI
ncbi:hypothetical protein LQ948_09675 [Jiella sp. MQZ9-1]|uniref:Uncharacterized protein n=1 Tax=Jiella flava TaxID=2816857 RepID=A0A939FX01_9HYPH|nr:hypothetical protein [Jiella flava]MBO0663057.1 hypothetical protein [Jiella flava]MCD2471476.1 hypothetical protein [Jiella flava]